MGVSDRAMIEPDNALCIIVAKTCLITILTHLAYRANGNKL